MKSAREKSMESSEGKVVIVAVTGASGAVLAQTALRMLDADPRVARIHLVVTETGLRLLEHELQHHRTAFRIAGANARFERR